MALATRLLMGTGKTIVGAGGAVLKGGAKLFGDDAVEAVGRTVGKMQKGMDDVVKASVKKDALYKAAKKEARVGIQEARQSSEAATEAITNSINKETGTINFATSDGTVYQRTKNPNWAEGDVRKSNGGRRNQWLYTKDGQSISGKEFGQAKKSFVDGGGAFNEGKIAKNMAETAAGDGAGFNLMQFASDHPVGTALAGLGVGVAGSKLFDDDD